MAIIELHMRDAIQLLTLKTMLESAGHTVHRDPKRIDTAALFCDVEAIDSVLPSSIPVITITSVAAIEDAVDAMRKGAWGYITVPFQAREAELTIERMLQHSGPIQSDPTLDTLPTMEAVEFEHIQRALRLCNGNQAKAARVLNIGRNTLWRKLKKMEQQRGDG